MCCSLWDLCDSGVGSQKKGRPSKANLTPETVKRNERRRKQQEIEALKTVTGTGTSTTKSLGQDYDYFLV